MDPFKGPYAVWLEKTGKIPLDEEERDVLIFGHKLEDDVIDEFERRATRIGRPLRVIERQVVVERLDIPYMRATLDGLVAEGSDNSPVGIFEGKTASARSYDWHRTGVAEKDIPMHVQIQCQHNMAVAQRDLAFVAVLLTVPVMDFRWWELKRDEDAIQDLYEIEAAFWKLVENDTPPPPDGSYGTLDAVKKAYSRSVEGKVIDLSSTDMEYLRARQQLYEQERRLYDQRRAIEASLISRLGDAEEGWFEGVLVVTRRAGMRHEIDVDKLKKFYPQIADEVMRETPTRPLKVFGKKFEKFLDGS